VGATVGSTTTGTSVAVGSTGVDGAPQAASTKLIATSTNINGRTNLVISIFSFIFLYAVMLSGGF
jgi:hypothetical protein